MIEKLNEVTFARRHNEFVKDTPKDIIIYKTDSVNYHMLKSKFPNDLGLKEWILLHKSLRASSKTYPRVLELTVEMGILFL